MPLAPFAVLLGAVAVVVGLFVLAVTSGGCIGGKLTPAAAAAIDVAIVDACPFESMIPEVGDDLVLFCPAEEAAARLALSVNTAVVAGMPDAGAPAPPAMSLIAKGRRVGLVVRHRNLKPANLDAGKDGAP
jgi:hypothetical protein